MCSIPAVYKAAGNAGGMASAATSSGYDEKLTQKAARWRTNEVAPSMINFKSFPSYPLVDRRGGVRLRRLGLRAGRHAAPHFELGRNLKVYMVLTNLGNNFLFRSKFVSGEKDDNLEP